MNERANVYLNLLSAMYIHQINAQRLWVYKSGADIICVAHKLAILRDCLNKKNLALT